MSSIRVSLVQLKVTGSKNYILQNTINQIRIAALEKNATLVVLPECFNCPYEEDALVESAEEIPTGETSQVLSRAAKDYGVYIVGGSIVERYADNLYITCPVWNPNGEVIARYRKMHLGDSNASTDAIVRESTWFTGGETFVTFDVGEVKVGLGICWDMRFPEFAACYRMLGCDVLIYPSLCDVHTGTKHWQLLARARALDNQLFVAFCSPARNVEAKLVAFGHSLVVDPWGEVIAMGKEKEDIVVADLKLDLLREAREHMPVMEQKRFNLYNSVSISDNQ
ncbi:AAEL000146-PA [Aedes aegypti]|uniref:omega-amidase n=1 Tax=Aedes aegypti TaxID=7159 RepID=Q17Q51_AEDAE|nr:AAEL000146-PA [Aedes aegypti]